MKILVTGSDGFIGKNLIARLIEKGHTVYKFTRNNNENELRNFVNESDFIFHLAGENRTLDDNDFVKNNTKLTSILCNAIIATGRDIPMVYTSTIHVTSNSPYGDSKLLAEKELIKLAENAQNRVYIYRLPGVFGKWAKPDYNSVVATFCHNIANELPINIRDEDHLLKLAYIDDVVEEFCNKITLDAPEPIQQSVAPVYSISLGALASQIYSFKESRETLITENVGNGLIRKLHATYLSYLPKDKFTYKVPLHADQRGAFVELVKTPLNGQFSYFTAEVGVTRGGHYHHTKTEKFIVVQGRARFRFVNIHSLEEHEVYVDGKFPEVVETIPGWWHDITNIGDDQVIAFLWANEIFDPTMPDTYSIDM